MSRCYICGRGRSDSGHYHAECLMKVFRSPVMPAFDYSLDELHSSLDDQIISGISLPGENLSLAFHCKVFRWHTPVDSELRPEAGEFILDLPDSRTPFLPEARHFFLKFAETLGIAAVPCALARLRSGETVLLRRRTDRTTKVKMPRHIEDFCQLAEFPARLKYFASMDDAADIVKRYSDSPAISLIRFFERTLFYFLSGCGGVHYKNLRMLCRRVVVGNYRDRQSKYDLEPLSDIMPPAFAGNGMPVEFAIPLRGKNNGLAGIDFEEFALLRCQMKKVQIRNAIQRLTDCADKNIVTLLKRSFLPEEYRDYILRLVAERITRMREVR